MNVREPLLVETSVFYLLLELALYWNVEWWGAKHNEITNCLIIRISMPFVTVAFVQTYTTELFFD